MPLGLASIQRQGAPVSKGVGDPQSEALTFAYQAGAGDMLSICEYTEFGSGFFREENMFLDDYDVVMIVFGKPAAPAAPVDAPAGPASEPAEPADEPVAVPPTTVPRRIEDGDS